MTHPGTVLAKPQPPCRAGWFALILGSNKTRQGYARKRILKPAGYFFVRPELAPLKRLEGAR